MAGSSTPPRIRVPLLGSVSDAAVSTAAIAVVAAWVLLTPIPRLYGIPTQGVWLSVLGGSALGVTLGARSGRLSAPVVLGLAALAVVAAGGLIPFVLPRLPFRYIGWLVVAGIFVLAGIAVGRVRKVGARPRELLVVGVVAALGLSLATREILAVGVVLVIVAAIAWYASTRWPLTRSMGAGIVRLQAVRERVGKDHLRILGQIALAAWFAGQTYMRIARFVRDKVPLGQDIRIYYRGIQGWLHGGDPWAAQVVVDSHHAFSYAGSPVTTVLLAPSALFSEDQFTLLWLGLSALSALAIVRWLRLPLWWLLFPPTAEALFSGNPQLVVLMLLLAGASRPGVLADAIAVALKVYAVIPLLGERRLRRVGLALVLTLATFVVAPSLWIHYAEQFGAISARLAQQSGNGYSAFYFPSLLGPTAIAIVLLWRRDPKAAAWLAVPALWPSTEFHYSTFAQPVMTPLLAVLLAVPNQRLAPVAIMLYVFWRFAAAPVQAHLAAWAAEAMRAREDDAMTGGDPNYAAGYPCLPLLAELRRDRLSEV